MMHAPRLLKKQNKNDRIPHQKKEEEEEEETPLLDPKTLLLLTPLQKV